MNVKSIIMKMEMIFSREAWSKGIQNHGYIAMVINEGKVSLERRDIVIALLQLLINCTFILFWHNKHGSL